jgi:class 3 adenylate cyclase
VDPARSNEIKSGAWRPRWLLTLALLALIGGFVGGVSDYTGAFPALGGPNGALYDLTLKISQPWRRGVKTVPAVFVAIDSASLSRPDLAALPRALFQPIWARLADGLLDAGAQRIAFDAVFAYAGSELQVGNFSLPDYDRSLIDTLNRGRQHIVLGQFPDLAPATAFLKAVGASRVGVLDLQIESDGIVRSVGPVVRLPDNRIAFGFAALAAGWSLSQASTTPRLLIAPSAPLTETPTYSLGTVLDCLVSADGARRVRNAIEGRVVVVGTSILGEDEHRGPTRFFETAVAQAPEIDPCDPKVGLDGRVENGSMPGGLIQIAAIQSTASERRVSLASDWLRALAGAALAALFGIFALENESALTIGEPGVSSISRMLVQVIHSTIVGLTGPLLVGGMLSVLFFIFAALWLPMGYPIITTTLAFATILGVRWGRHRALFGRLYRTAGRYLPPARLAALARSGFVEIPSGQEREVSILLADLKGFTSFSNARERSASEVVAVVNRYFTMMQSAIDRHGGCSDKYLGDAVLAFWNGISDEPNHALKALLAARDIVSAVSEADSLIDTRLAARVVVCSGRVYVGDVGSKQRSNFTIIGPAVNESFRMEKLPDHYGVSLLIGGSTVETIAASTLSASLPKVLAGTVLVRLDDVMLKGFDEPRSVYTLAPDNDPGVAIFQAGRLALDQGRVCEGLTFLNRIEGGILHQAAKNLSSRYSCKQRTGEQ